MRLGLMALAVALLVPGGVNAMDLTAWTAPAALKIHEDAKPDVSGLKAVRLKAAGGEFAAFQVALRSEGGLKDVSVQVTDLNGPARIGAARVSVWREHYVATNEGRLPDPLSPLKTVDLQPGVCQPVYVEVQAPEDAPAGRYTGEVQVLAEGKPVQRAALELDVRDFQLPATPSFTTAFGNQYDWIATQEGISPSGETFQNYCRAYYELLLSHRISPYNIPVDLMSPAAESYLTDPRMTSYIIPYLDDDAKLKALVEHLRQNGWLKKGYYYVVDEPFTRESFQQIDKVVERLKRIQPDYRLVAPYFCNPDFDKKLTVYKMLKGKVNIWCAVTNFQDETELDARRAAGETVWNYVCCGPGKPYANFFIPLDAMDHRVLFWQEWKYRSEGLLYWSTIWWDTSENGTKDPWEDMATIKWINKDIYGDGSLLYPGHKVGHYGPLPSLRLKMIRQGLQDYEYIHLAEQRAGRAKAEAVVDTQVKSWTEFQKDPVALEAAKDKLAELIDSAAR